MFTKQQVLNFAGEYVQMNDIGMIDVLLFAPDQELSRKCPY
jgi:hypothetical protein